MSRSRQTGHIGSQMTRLFLGDADAALVKVIGISLTLKFLRQDLNDISIWKT